MLDNITKYKREIRSLFPVFGSYEKRFYKDIEFHITEFMLRYPNATRSDLEKKLGAPKDIIRDYFSIVDSDKLSKQLTRTKHFRMACACFVGACLVSLSLLSIFYYHSYSHFYDNIKNNSKTYMETEE